MRVVCSRITICVQSDCKQHFLAFECGVRKRVVVIIIGFQAVNDFNHDKFTHFRDKILSHHAYFGDKLTSKGVDQL